MPSVSPVRDHNDYPTQDYSPCYDPDLVFLGSPQCFKKIFKWENPPQPTLLMYVFRIGTTYQGPKNMPSLVWLQQSVTPHRHRLSSSLTTSWVCCHQIFGLTKLKHTKASEKVWQQPYYCHVSPRRAGIMWICTMVRPVWFSCTSGNVFVGILFMTELKTIESFTLRMALPENVSDAQMLVKISTLSFVISAMSLRWRPCCAWAVRNC